MTRTIPVMSLDPSLHHCCLSLSRFPPNSPQHTCLNTDTASNRGSWGGAGPPAEPGDLCLCWAPAPRAGGAAGH